MNARGTCGISSAAWSIAAELVRLEILLCHRGKAAGERVGGTGPDAGPLLDDSQDVEGHGPRRVPAFMGSDQLPLTQLLGLQVGKFVQLTTLYVINIGSHTYAIQTVDLAGVGVPTHHL